MKKQHYTAEIPVSNPYNIAAFEDLGQALVGEELERGQVELALEGMQHRHDRIEVRVLHPGNSHLAPGVALGHDHRDPARRSAADRRGSDRDRSIFVCNHAAY